MHRPIGATLVALLAAAAAGGPAAATPKVRLWQTRDVAVTEGYVDVQATPTELYAAITDYSRWPALFSDIELVRHKRGGREDAVLELKSRTYGKRVQHFKFRNRPHQLVYLVMDDGPPGVKLWEQITFEGTALAGIIRVRIRMHISVGGLLGWLTTTAKVQKYRERKVRRDLEDLGRRWAPKTTLAADGG